MNMGGKVDFFNIKLAEGQFEHLTRCDKYFSEGHDYQLQEGPKLYIKVLMGIGHSSFCLIVFKI